MSPKSEPAEALSESFMIMVVYIHLNNIHPNKIQDIAAELPCPANFHTNNRNRATNPIRMSRIFFSPFLATILILLCVFVLDTFDELLSDKKNHISFPFVRCAFS